MNLRSALKVYKRDAVRNALVSLIEDRLDARIRENVPCGRGWVGNKGKGKKCKRAPKGSAAKQMRVKRKRLGKSAEPAKARYKEKAQVSSSSQSTQKQVAIPKLAKNKVISTDSRFSSESLDIAFDAINTPGAKDRVTKLKNIIEQQGIQSVWNPRKAVRNKIDTLYNGLENAGASGRLVNSYKQILANLDPIKKEVVLKRIKSSQKRVVSLPGNAAGITSPDWRHVVVAPEKRGAYSEFKVESKSLSKAFDEIETRSERKGFPAATPWSVSTATKGDPSVSWSTNDFITYLHEVGHQVQFVTDKSSRRGLGSTNDIPKKSLTRYGETNKLEWFAEHFALWVMDAERLNRIHPEAANYIENSVNQATKAARRMDTKFDKMSENSKNIESPQMSTELGRRALEIVKSEDKSKQAYEALLLIDEQSTSEGEKIETGSMIEAFVAAGGFI